MSRKRRAHDKSSYTPEELAIEVAPPELESPQTPGLSLEHAETELYVPPTEVLRDIRRNPKGTAEELVSGALPAPEFHSQMLLWLAAEKRALGTIQVTFLVVLAPESYEKVAAHLETLGVHVDHGADRTFVVGGVTYHLDRSCSHEGITYRGSAGGIQRVESRLGAGQLSVREFQL